MSRISQWLRDLVVETALWCQRYKWLLPTAVRNIARGAASRAVQQAAALTPRGADGWPHLSVGEFQSDDPAVYLPSHEPMRHAMDIALTNSIRGTRDPVWPHAHSNPRCMVATGTLDLGGLEVVALFLGRGLPSHGLDTLVAHTPLARSGERPADSLRFEGIPVIRLPESDVRQWLETHRPDVISMHTPPQWLVAAAAEAGIPSIETLHGAHNFFDRDSWPGEQLRSRQITGFVAVSELVRRQYLRANPRYPSDRVITIPNGVDDQHISQRDRTQARAWLSLRDEFLFVSLARYTLQKNTFGLVTAFGDVARAHPEAHLLLAGGIINQAYFEQVRRLRDGLPCAGQIHLRGPCPDVSAVLAAADAFVLDSFFEGWSLASMEALFAGLPVVLSEVGGAREQVGENGRRGFVVANPLGDPEAMDWRAMGLAQFRPQTNRGALVEAMSTVVTNRDRWRDAREKLRVEAAALFSADICLRRHAEVLTRAAASGHLHSPIGATL